MTYVYKDYDLSHYSLTHILINTFLHSYYLERWRVFYKWISILFKVINSVATNTSTQVKY